MMYNKIIILALGLVGMAHAEYPMPQIYQPPYYVLQPAPNFQPAPKGGLYRYEDHSYIDHGSYPPIRRNYIPPKRVKPAMPHWDGHVYVR